MRKYYLSATGVLAGFATSLLVIAPTVFIGAFFHHQFNGLDIESVKFLILGALAGTFLGAFIANVLPSEALGVFFGIFVILFSAKMFLRKDFDKMAEKS